MVSSKGSFYGEPIFGAADDHKTREQSVQDVLPVDVKLASFEGFGGVCVIHRVVCLCVIHVPNLQLFFHSPNILKSFFEKKDPPTFRRAFKPE